MHFIKEQFQWKTLCLVAVFVITAQGAFAAGSDWVIRKSRWTAADERGYSEFVQALGASGCNTVDRCLKSPANPYRGSDPVGVYWDADCGKFPFLLRGYYAWKNGLPFSYASDVESADGRNRLYPRYPQPRLRWDEEDDGYGNGGDIRYSLNGNVVVRRIQITQPTGKKPLNGMRELRRMQGEVNTAMYRIHPLRDGRSGSNFPDFYSVAINRDNIRPGTVVYDAAGHAVTVFKVEPDGRVRYFDAHPDRTVSRGVYGAKFARSRPGAGAGFKNFRPLALVGAAQNERGEWVGGTVVSANALSSLPGFSVEQYWGIAPRIPYKDNDWSRARFAVNGRNVNYYDYVRAQLAIGQLKFHPVIEMQNAMEALCGDIQDRVLAVDTALASGIQEKSHPDRLPGNIYGTDGEWEEMSTPSRDARLKASFREIRQRVEEMVELYKRKDLSIDYPGTDLAQDLRNAYVASANACKISYKKSNGMMQTLGYEDIVQRLWALSFDPYNCVELRWGASSNEELASCRDSNNKFDWYKAEQRLRNQIERTYDVRMAFTLSDLIRRAPNTGVDQAPDVNLKGYLDTLGTIPVPRLH